METRLTVAALEIIDEECSVFDLQVEQDASFIVAGVVLHNSTICRDYAGRIWNLNFKPIGHSLPFNGGPPRHLNCRSSVIPILLDEDPAQDITLAKWLRRQSEEKLRALTGSKRYELWRKDKITDQDLIRQEGRQMTFEQLRNKN